MNTRNMKGIIVVLGAPNSDKGELSEIANNRLDKVLRFLKMNTGYKILCTGGFGPHFNTTDQPHAKYAADYLKEKGVAPDDILTYVLSNNTQDDVLKAKPVIQSYQPENLIIITSDFHMERASILFKRHLQEQNLIFVEATSTLGENRLKQLIAHEKNALKKL